MRRRVTATRLKAGDLVELRDPAEIVATLDETGSLDGLPFMPEMLAYFGRRVRVEANLERVCDTIQPVAVRKIPGAVLLDDFRCDGSGHGGCQARCRLYWKEAWLRRWSPGDAPRPSAGTLPEYGTLERLSKASATGGTSTTDEPRFRCQATELRRASTAVPSRDIGSLFRQLTSRNFGVLAFLRVLARATAIEFGVRLRLVSRFPFMPPNPPGHRFEEPEPRGLEPGARVRVRSREAIGRTLDAHCKNRGLWFDREMLLHCGRTTRVQARVQRFIEEKSGRLIELESDCYMLEGAICTGVHSDGRWFCPRAIHSWWRESWLEPIDEVGSNRTP